MIQMVHLLKFTTSKYGDSINQMVQRHPLKAEHTFSDETSWPAWSNSSGAMKPGVPTGEFPTLIVNAVDTWLMP